MSDKLVIQIDDSQGDPRCAILWKWGGSDASKYTAYLAYAIGSLSDKATTEEIIENIREVFPSVGIPRSLEFYTRNRLGMAEYTLSTKYADDLGLPDSTPNEGVLAVSQRAIDEFSCWADSLNGIQLGNVTLMDCIFEEDLANYCCLYDYEEESEGYADALHEMEDIQKSAFHTDKNFVNRRITTKEDWDELLRVINSYDWVEYNGIYYHVD